MRPIRVVIADDEPIARQRLRRLVTARDDCLVVAEFADGVALGAGIAELRADLILLDIEMPGRNGFASLSGLPDPKPLVVFVTAFAEFATRAFDVDAVDYLMKPVSAARLDEAVSKIKRRLDRPGISKAPVPEIARFVVQGRIYLFEQARLSTLRALGNYVELTTDTQRVQLRTTLAAAHSRLNANRFIRVHRSWIVRRTAIAQVTSLPGSRYELKLADGRCIPGGRAYARAMSGYVRFEG